MHEFDVLCFVVFVFDLLKYFSEYLFFGNFDGNFNIPIIHMSKIYQRKITAFHIIGNR